MAANMKDNMASAKMSGALDGPAQQYNRFVKDCFIGRSEIDEIGRVDDHRREAALGSGDGKCCRRVWLARRWRRIARLLPGGWVIDKNLDGFTAKRLGDLGCLKWPGVGRDVTAKFQADPPSFS